MASVINVHEAKTHFSKLLARVARGEEVVIAKAGKPVAKLVPTEAAPVPRQLDTAKGQIWMSDDFDGPLAEDVLKGFYGEE